MALDDAQKAAYRKSIDNLNAWRGDANTAPAPVETTFRRDIDAIEALASKSTRSDGSSDDAASAYERSIQSLNSWRNGETRSDDAGQPTTSAEANAELKRLTAKKAAEEAEREAKAKAEAKADLPPVGGTGTIPDDQPLTKEQRKAIVETILARYPGSTDRKALEARSNVYLIARLNSIRKAEVDEAVLTEKALGSERARAVKAEREAVLAQNNDAYQRSVQSLNSWRDQ